MRTTASSLAAIAQYFWRIRTSVLYGNQQKFNIEAVNYYLLIRFERKFPIRRSLVLMNSIHHAATDRRSLDNGNTTVSCWRLQHRSVHNNNNTAWQRQVQPPQTTAVSNTSGLVHQPLRAIRIRIAGNVQILVQKCHPRCMYSTPFQVKK